MTMMMDMVMTTIVMISMMTWEHRKVRERRKIMTTTSPPPLGGTYSISFANQSHLINVIHTTQSGDTIGIESSAGRIQLGAVILAEFRSKGVDGDGDGTTIGLELISSTP